MNVSQLISELEDIIEEYGDREVILVKYGEAGTSLYISDLNVDDDEDEPITINITDDPGV